MSCVKFEFAEMQERFKNDCEGEDYQWRATINSNLVLLITQGFLCMALEDLNMELYKPFFVFYLSFL